MVGRLEYKADTLIDVMQVLLLNYRKSDITSFLVFAGA